jgi:hypothetical protein
MFWNEPKGYRGVPHSSKIAVTAFLVIAGIGYILGFLNILLTYEDADQKPGLGIEDIRISFYGAREKTALEASIDGSMKTYFSSDADYRKVKDWLAAGADNVSFDRDVQPIFAVSCNSCHSTAARVADVVTETYQDIEPLLEQDTGKSVSRLVSLSHTHLLSTLVVVFGLVLIFSQTLFGEPIKIGVIAFAFLALLLDIGAWWLAKLASGLAFLVIVGGASLAASFAVLIFLSLYDVWLRRPPA